MTNKIIKKKLNFQNTINSIIKMEDKPLTIVETFVGAGGAHLGFKQAGFESLLVNDNDKDTIDTLIQNKAIESDKYILAPVEDITEEQLQEKIQGKEVDVLFGGIVCKGFSLAGVRNPFDPRNYLYKHQLRLVGILKPKVSVIENVTALKNMFLYQNCQETQEIFEAYTTLSDKNKTLNGIKSSKRKSGENYSEITTQINENKKKMKQMIESIDSYKFSVLEEIKKTYQELGYTFYEKILQTNKYGGYTSRQRIIMVAVRNDLNKTYEYPEELSCEYTLNDALNLIDYVDKNNPEKDIDNKPMNHNEKTVNRFTYIPEGKNIADIVDTLPEDLKISSFFSRGNTQRLDRHKPSPTLVPGHSNFPIHPWEHRSITVREAATITGFPLDYNFIGSHSSRCIQIGNAVPVQLAYHIALSIKNMLLST